MRYVIMANGKGTRWNNHGGHAKHLIKVDGETLLQRTTRMVLERCPDAEVIITSHNPDCVAEGATRYEPERSDYEIDRFCYELIEDDVCFLYGDAFYSEKTLDLVVGGTGEGMLFFGSSRCIVAVKVFQGAVMKTCLDQLFALMESGDLVDAKGWQLYHQYLGLPLVGRNIAEKYVLIEDETTDFNRPDDYQRFMDSYGKDS